MTSGFIKNLGFFIFVFLIGTWVLYDYKNQSQESNLSSTNFLKDIDFNQVKSFLFKSKKGKIQLTKKSDNWHLFQPVKDFSSLTYLTTWFNSLKKEKLIEIKTQTPISWSDYYLDPGFFVELTLDTGKKLKFFISSKSSFDGKYFIRKEDRLFIGSRLFFENIIGKSFEDFRSLKIINHVGHPKQISYKGKKTFTFKWQNYKWNFSSFPLKNNIINDFWSFLVTQKAKKILTQDEDFKKARLYAVIELSFKTHILVIKIKSLDQSRFFIQTNQRKAILEFDSKTIQPWLLTETVLRDHGRAFQFDKNQLASAQIKTSKKQFVVNKSDIGSDAVQIFLNQILNLKAKKYSKALIKSKSRSLVLKDADNKLIFSLKEGASFKENKEELTWVKTNLQKEKQAVSSAILNKIFALKIKN